MLCLCYYTVYCIIITTVVSVSHSTTSCRCKYRCFVSRSRTDFPQDDCCLCAVGAIRLSTGLDMEDILYVNLENKVGGASVCTLTSVVGQSVCIES